MQFSHLLISGRVFLLTVGISFYYTANVIDKDSNNYKTLMAGMKNEFAADVPL